MTLPPHLLYLFYTLLLLPISLLILFQSHRSIRPPVLAPDMPKIITQVFEITETGHEVKIDIVLPEKVGEGKVPVVVAFHGGGLVRGSRRDPYLPQPILDCISSQGYILINADYRLLVPSTGYSIQADMTSLFTHLLTPSFSLSLTPHTPDLHRLALIGTSAGGYPLRLASILSAKEAGKATPGWTVRASISYFGMGGDWFQPSWIQPCSLKGVPNTPLSPSTMQATQARLWEDVKELYEGEGKDIEVSDCPYTETMEGYREERRALWEYWHGTATILDAVTGVKGLGSRLGFLPEGERGAAVPQEARGLFPQLWLAEEENAKSYPNTILIHGTNDEAVPYEESVLTERLIREGGGRVEMITVEGGDHGLEILPGVWAPGTAAAHQRVVDFMVDALL